jgi:hypothetical protein
MKKGNLVLLVINILQTEVTLSSSHLDSLQSEHEELRKERSACHNFDWGCHLLLCHNYKWQEIVGFSLRHLCVLMKSRLGHWKIIRIVFF